MSFIDQLGIIGGTLGVAAGMSVLSMVEVVVFVYIILDGIYHDIRNLKKTVLSYLKGKEENSENMTCDANAKSLNKKHIGIDEFEEDQHEIKRIYVSI